MKFLTLNTHSWMEKDPKEKFRLLLQDILEQDYDLICFQEINQEISSILAETDELYHPLPSAEPIHQDHYIYLLVQELKKAGREYYWTWAYNHIGYDRYHEGVGILSKNQIQAREILVSDVDDPTDYHTRRVALVETTVDGKDLAVASVHLSWWDKGFQEEWARFESVLTDLNKPLLLAGDFNNPAGQEGYQTILASPLSLQDAYEAAQERSGSYTVPPEIDGWKGNSEPLRIDYVFTTKDLQVKYLHVVFDGQNSPQVSDHYGLKTELIWKD